MSSSASASTPQQGQPRPNVQSTSQGASTSGNRSGNRTHQGASTSSSSSRRPGRKPGKKPVKKPSPKKPDPPPKEKLRIRPLHHKYEKRRLSKAEWKKKLEVLAKFYCPFADKCKQGEKCFFSHKAVVENDPEIRKLPLYCCVMHLTGGCCQIPYPRKNAMRQRCDRGFHMTYDELDNIPKFEEANAKLIEEGQCSVCYDYLTLKDKTTTQGYMVNCVHVFCVGCITTVYSNPDKDKRICPNCRTPGPFINSRRKPTAKAKARVLKKYKKEANAERSAADQEATRGMILNVRGIIDNVEEILGPIQQMFLEDDLNDWYDHSDFEDDDDGDYFDPDDYFENGDEDPDMDFI